MNDLLTPRKLSAILHADAAGFSRLMEADEEQTHRRLSAALRTLITTIETHSGRVIKTAGDAVLAEFSSVVNAVRAAVSVQRAFAEENRNVPNDRQLAFRIGVNLGDIIVDGDDIFGDGVNVAARLESLAEPGGICISGTAFDQLSGKIDAEISYIGEHKVKNIERPIRVYRVVINPHGNTTRFTFPARRILLIVIALSAVLTFVYGVEYWFIQSLNLGDTDKSGAVSLGRPLIAVLPFINIGGEAQDNTLSIAITEDLIGELGRYSDLAVLGMSAVLPLQQTSVAPAELGRTLGAQFLVRGSVRTSPDRTRVHVELTDTQRGRLLWSGQFETERLNILVLQQEIARTIAGTLAANLDRVEEQRASVEPIHNLDAYDRVLRARSLLRKVDRTANREARKLLESALELDPGQASAHALLGQAIYDTTQNGWTEFPHQALEKAENEAQRAISLDERNVAGHALLGRIYTMKGQYERGLSEIDRAIALNPSDTNSLNARAQALLWSGRIDDAIKATEASFRIDPTPNLATYIVAGMAYYLAERFEESSQILERALVRFPANGQLLPVLAAAYAQMGNRDEAVRVIAMLRHSDPLFDPQTFGSRLQNPEHRALLREGLHKAGSDGAPLD
jgi:class 3 adenylate cyclase/TolB-like protein/cytochrome c-type biogenesis protein CcmH/NrfG